MPPFAGDHQVDRETPARQAGLGLLEEGALEDRMLLTADAAFLDQPQAVSHLRSLRLGRHPVNRGKPPSLTVMERQALLISELVSH